MTDLLDLSPFAREVAMGGEIAKCREDPKALLAHMKGYDPTRQEWFQFEMGDPHAPWGWQGLIIDWWMGALTPEREVLLREFMGWWDGDIDPKLRKFIILKARQLGVTWLAVALGLWYILFRPGSAVVAWSQGLDEAKLLIQRAWLMFQALPLELRAHARVLSPQRAEIPSEQIVLLFEDGTMSTFTALPDTQKAGQSRTITLGIMDELARMEYARGIWGSVNPAVARGGCVIGVSTAEGQGNMETEEGNFFAILWHKRKVMRLSAAFLPWNLHPERDDEWYETEAMALPHIERNRSYPLSPEDAFILSGDLYFDVDSLAFYRGESARHRVLYRGEWIRRPNGEQAFDRHGGIIEVLEEPRAGAKYGISADSATGRSKDYSVGHVIDLDSGAIVAKVRGKMDIPAFSFQLKCLGRWYHFNGQAAQIIPERTGVGEALVVALRTDADGLKPYGNIYQHITKSNLNQPINQFYGFPMQMGTRAMVLENLRAWLKKQSFPWLLAGDVEELETFIYRDTGTSPRAMEGCNDDCVMSLALAVHLFTLKGETPRRALRTAAKKALLRAVGYVAPPTLDKGPVAQRDRELEPGGRYPPIHDERNEDGSRK